MQIADSCMRWQAAGTLRFLSMGRPWIRTAAICICPAQIKTVFMIFTGISWTEMASAGWQAAGSLTAARMEKASIICLERLGKRGFGVMIQFRKEVRCLPLRLKCIWGSTKMLCTQPGSRKMGWWWMKSCRRRQGSRSGRMYWARQFRGRRLRPFMRTTGGSCWQQAFGREA